jgi:hypothetical protein
MFPASDSLPRGAARCRRGRDTEPNYGPPATAEAVTAVRAAVRAAVTPRRRAVRMAVTSLRAAVRSTVRRRFRNFRAKRFRTSALPHRSTSRFLTSKRNASHMHERAHATTRTCNALQQRTHAHAARCDVRAPSTHRARAQVYRARSRCDVYHTRARTRGVACVRVRGTLGVCRAMGATGRTGDGMGSRKGSANVARAYDDAARRDLGRVGETVTGHAYVWCARGSHYHYALARDVGDVRDTLSRIRHGRVRLTWHARTRAPRTDVRASGHALDRDAYRRAIAYGRAFDRMRAQGTDAVPTAWPCVAPSARDASHDVTPRASATMARASVWGARNADHDAWARAFDARLAARDA